jgi:archaellum component FlaC
LQSKIDDLTDEQSNSLKSLRAKVEERKRQIAAKKERLKQLDTDLTQVRDTYQQKRVR